MDGDPAVVTASSGLGRYRIEREVGRGTMGVVYRAQDTILGHTVALKMIHLALPVSPACREAFEDRFLAEAQMAARLSHPNVVRVHDFGRDCASPALFIALEYVEGAPLSEVVSAPEPLPWAEALRIGERVAEALGHAHAHGIVHRDVKPANIMLTPAGEPKVLDFGIARIVEPQGPGPTTGRLVGTPLYMAPEQALGRPVDARGDIFALGAVLYFLLTGRPPFAAPTIPGILLRVVREDPLPPSWLVPGLPDDVDYVVARATAKSTAHRYPDARSMAEDMSDIRAFRPPRHRSAWRPPNGNDTLPFVAGDAALAALEAELLVPLDVPPAAAASLWTSIAGVATLVDAPSKKRTRPSRVTGGVALLLAAVATAGFASRRSGRPSEASGPAGVPAPATRAVGALEVRSPAVVPRIPAAVRSGQTPPRATPAVTAGTAAPALSVPALAAPSRPAHLAVELEHSLKTGRLRLWVDEILRIDQGLGRRAQRRAAVGEVLEIEPGPHQLKLEVSWDDDVRTARASATFLPGESRWLTAHLGGLFRKNIAMAWNETLSASPAAR